MQYLYRYRNELLIIRIICDEPTKSRFSLFPVFFICLVKFSMRSFTLSPSLSFFIFIYLHAPFIYPFYAVTDRCTEIRKIPGIGWRKEDDKEFNQAMTHVRHLFYPTMNDLSRSPAVKRSRDKTHFESDPRKLLK